MNELQAESVEKRTLMIAVSLLEDRYRQLTQLSELTGLLNEKLNRTEGDIKCDNDIKKQETINYDIVELFYNLSEKLEEQINIIGGNTERSMSMID